MKIIVDTNIIFSALLYKKNKYFDILMDSESLTFFTCNFLIVEIFKYKEKIIRCSNAKDDLLSILSFILHKIHFISDDLVSTDSKYTAFQLCKGIDEKDTPFVALAIELNGLLWTRDKKLEAHLIEQGFDQLYHVS